MTWSEVDQALNTIGSVEDVDYAPPSPGAINSARRVVDRLRLRSVPPAFVVSDGDGGITLEWRHNGVSVRYRCKASDVDDVEMVEFVAGKLSGRARVKYAEMF